jgi:hypothetical protein
LRINITNLGGSIELSISSSFAFDSPPVPFGNTALSAGGSIPAKRGASNFTKVSGGVTDIS